jgi:Lon protease-like protein
MSEDLLSPLAGFQGTVRLFPLPNVVLFPHVTQKLHIFEPRYRQMTADALAGDRLIAMALLRPGWEADYEGAPPVWPAVCVGRIVAHKRLPDGRYDLQLQGLSRARIEEELHSDKLYRRARVRLLRDSPVVSLETEAGLRRELLRLVSEWCRESLPAAEALEKLIQGGMRLGGVGDVLCYVLPLPAEFRQEQLDDTDVERRVRRLLEHMDRHKPARQRFPPEFSVN